MTGLKPSSMVYASLVAITFMFSALSFYGNMMSDYSSFNATSKINRSDEYLADYQDMQDDMAETGDTAKNSLWDALGRVPLLGTIIVTIFAPIQMLVSYLRNLWSVFDFGTELVTMSVQLLNVPIPGFVKDNVEIAIVFALLSGFAYAIANRRT